MECKPAAASRPVRVVSHLLSDLSAVESTLRARLHHRTIHLHMFPFPAGAILHDQKDGHVHPSSRLLLLGRQLRPGLLLDIFSGERRMRIASGGRERRIRIVLVNLLVDHGDDCVRCRTHLHSHPQHPGDPGNQETGVQRGSADTSAQGRQRSHFRRKFDRKFETFGDDGHAPGRFFLSHRDDASGHHTLRPLSDVPRRKRGVEGRSQESRPHLAEALHVQRNPDRDRRTRAFALRLQLLHLPPDRENIPSPTSIVVDKGVLPRPTLQRCTARLVHLDGVAEHRAVRLDPGTNHQ